MHKGAINCLQLKTQQYDSWNAYKQSSLTRLCQECIDYYFNSTWDSVPLDLH